MVALLYSLEFLDAVHPHTITELYNVLVLTLLYSLEFLEASQPHTTTELLGRVFLTLGLVQAAFM